MQEMQETWVQSLGWEDPLEEGMATHPNILAWRIPWMEEPSWHMLSRPWPPEEAAVDGPHGETARAAEPAARA